jgi:hypothetical protein
MFAHVVYKDDLFIRYWKEQRRALLEKADRGKRPVDVGSVTMGYRLNTAKTGSVAQSLLYSKGGFILHMLRMLMWDPKTGDQRFLAMMKDFVKSHFNRNVATQDFRAVVERHMVPDYKLEHRFEPGQGGKVDLVGRITQSRVDDKFKMRFPSISTSTGK